jgi:hypothetical protein
MNVRIKMFAGVAAFVGLIGLNNAQAQSVTGQVYGISLSGGVVIPTSISTNQEIVLKGSFTSGTIVSLARGYAPTLQTPPNERLALVFAFNSEGSPAIQLVVFDTNGQSNLAVVAEDLKAGGAIDSAKGKGTVAIGGFINPVGYLTGGWLAMTGKATVSGTGADTTIESFSGNAVQGVFDGHNVEDFEAIVTKGKAKLTGKLGTVVMP